MDHVKLHLISQAIVVAVLAALATAGCVADEVYAPAAEVEHVSAIFDVRTLPEAATFEDPPMLELARADSQFAGFYFNDHGQVEVLMTGDEGIARVEGRIRQLLGSARGAAIPLIRKSATYSFLELARYRTVLRQQIFDVPGVVSLGVRESANRVKVGIEHSRAEANVRILMNQLGVPQDAVIFVPDARGTDLILRAPASGTSSASSTLTLQDPHPAGLIQGGWEIRNSAGWVCTLG